MKIEPIGTSKIRAHVSHSDLAEHGLTTDLILRDPIGANKLIDTILDEAYHEFGFDMQGAFSVEMVVIPNEGLILILSSSDSRFYPNEQKVEKPQFINQIVYCLTDIELVISAAKILRRLPLRRGKLISYQNKYYLLFDRITGRDISSADISAILGEYGDSSNLTEHFLIEYGKVIIPKEAVRVLASSFK
jgi:adapter protein MecA 1/2